MASFGHKTNFSFNFFSESSLSFFIRTHQDNPCDQNFQTTTLVNYDYLQHSFVMFFFLLFDPHKTIYLLLAVDPWQKVPTQFSVTQGPIVYYTLHAVVTRTDSWVAIQIYIYGIVIYVLSFYVIWVTIPPTKIHTRNINSIAIPSLLLHTHPLRCFISAAKATLSGITTP